MGKPIAKKYLGDQESNVHIKAYFHNGTEPTPGFIIKQLGNKKFKKYFGNYKFMTIEKGIRETIIYYQKKIN